MAGRDDLLAIPHTLIETKVTQLAMSRGAISSDLPEIVDREMPVYLISEQDRCSDPLPCIPDNQSGKHNAYEYQEFVIS